MRLAIPTQTGLLAAVTSTKTAAITGGDRFEFPLSSGRYWFVTSDGVKPVDNGYVYLVTVREERALTLGQRS